MAIIKTIIKVPSLDAIYNIPGSFTGAELQSMYAASINGIANMTFTSVDSTTPEGEVREVTFSPRTGNKG